jgi:hypothetical protein
MLKLYGRGEKLHHSIFHVRYSLFIQGVWQVHYSRITNRKSIGLVTKIFPGCRQQFIIVGSQRSHFSQGAAIYFTITLTGRSDLASHRQRRLPNPIQATRLRPAVLAA